MRLFSTESCAVREYDISYGCPKCCMCRLKYCRELNLDGKDSQVRVAVQEEVERRKQNEEREERGGGRGGESKVGQSL